MKSLDQIRTLSNEELMKLAVKNNITIEFKRVNIILELLKVYLSNGYAIKASGTIEISNDKFGFLRTSDNAYLPSRNDIYVSADIVNEYYLKTGDIVEGMLKQDISNTHYPALEQVISINYGTNLKNRKSIIRFNDLIPEFPQERIIIDSPGTDSDSITGRLISMIAPIGFGQRALIVAPPRTGKTFVLKSIINNIEKNHKDAILLIFLVDERPEEVTEMKKLAKSEVISSTFDELPSRHVKIAEMVLNKAKRLVESGKNVIILLDSITRLARAYNAVAPSSGRALSGGVESNALQKPKRFFGAARNISNGGSLTIISTALVETGSRMDEVIFEEFKGTGNCEIHLDRKVSEKRIFPALDIHKSGTRMDHILFKTYDENRPAKIAMLRHIMSNMNNVEALDFLLCNIRNSENNEQFFQDVGKNRP